MALGDLWSRTLVYFGIAEEDDDWDDEDGYAAEESLEQSYRERPNVRRLTPRRGRHEYDDWTESSGEPRAARPRAAPAARSRACAVERARPPRAPAQLQRRAADRRPLQAGDPGDPQPAERRRRVVEAADRLHERPHLRAQRRHAARRRQGLPADAPQRRGERRAARPDPRTRRLLQPGLNRRPRA